MIIPHLHKALPVNINSLQVVLLTRCYTLPNAVINNNQNRPAGGAMRSTGRAVSIYMDVGMLPEKDCRKLGTERVQAGGRQAAA